MEYSDFQHLRFERRANGVLLITINRPDHYNAANARLHEELAEIWLTIKKDAAVRVAVITGAGSAFSVGGDLSEGIAALGHVTSVAVRGLAAPDVPGSFRTFVRTPPMALRDGAPTR